MPGASPNSPGRRRAMRLVVIAQSALLIVSAFGLPAPMSAAGNNALQLDGTNDYVTFGAAPSLGVTTFTLETWFKRTGAGVGVTTGTGGITSAIPLVTKAAPQGETPNEINANYFLGIDATSGKLVADFEEPTGPNHPVTGNAVVTSNVWHHAAVTYNATTGTWNLYLDGVLDQTLVLTSAFQPQSASTQHAALGTSLTSAGAAAGFFAGVIDEARVWNVVRTGSEIAATRDSELTAGTGLIARWGINEGTGTVVGNSIAGGVSGTASNGPTWVPGFNATPANALQLDGTNDYVTFGAAPSLGVTTFTLETWFKRTGAGVGVTTGTGGITSAIPLVTKAAPQGETPNEINANYFLGIDATSGKLVADFEEPTGPNHPVTGNAVVTSNVWHHAAVTYNATTGTWNLYLDGVLDQTLVLTSAFQPQSASTQHAALGTSLTSAGAAAGFFAGVIDEARVWNVVRTGSEIAATRDSELTAGTGLIARWGINEGTGTVVGNSIAGGVSGTASNGPTWVPGFVPPVLNAAPAAPTLNAPANATTGVGTSPTLSIAVSDPDSDPLTVTFFGRPLASGTFSQIAQNTAVASGATTTTTWSSLGAGQTFEWYATVSDGTAATTGPTWTFSTAPGSDPVFVGAGDIADCARTQDEATAAIVGGVSGTVWTTGDNVYPTGTAANYTNCYEPSWGGAIKARTRPVPGNHDWSTGTPPETLAPYRAYFGASATDANNKDYYSYDIAASNWHVVNLDSECQLVTGGCAAGSPQEVWLAADLAANSSKNVIALWHKPRYSSGITNYQTVQPLWDDLYAAGVDILLVGHDHVYERFVPIKSGATLASQPVADPTYGIHSFTVGTGGAAGQSFGTPLTTSAARAPGSTYGVLKLTLHASTYDWTFLPIAGGTYTDSGTGSVHAAPPPANSAPVAVADSYSTAQDTALVQAAPGVLANDTDADANPLTAVLDTNVTNGSLTLNANGGFSYTPTAGYSGPDSFTYHATDGTADSNVVTVSLTVGASGPVVPGTPTAVSAVAGDASAQLSWTAPSSDGGSAITDYEITPYVGATPQTPILVGSAATSTTVSGLTNGTAYTFTVAAINAIGTGSASAASNAVTPLAPLGDWAAYADLRSAAGDTNAANVLKVPAGTIDQYGVGSPINPATSFTLTDRTTGRDTDARLQIANSGLNVASNNGASSTGGPAYAVFGGIVDGNGVYSFSEAGDVFQLNFSGVDPAKRYTVVLSTNRDENVAPERWADLDLLGVAASTEASGGTTMVVSPTHVRFPARYNTVRGDLARWTNIDPGADGTFSVRANLRLQDGSDRSYVPVQLLLREAVSANPVVPGTPTAVSAVAGDASAQLSWTAPSSDGGSAITDYEITPYVGATPQTPILVGSAATSTTVSGLTNGTAYTFTVAAINAIGTGSASAASNAVTPLAPNTVPAAVADAYTTAQDVALTVAAPGVLANDTDADSDPLTAILDTTVTNGSLTLNANGGFTYTPTPGYSGPDSFTYHATDGTVGSNAVTVSLTVSAPAGSNALQLGGASYVTFGDPAKLDLGQFTIETWFKQTGTGTPNTTGTGGITVLPLLTHGAPEADGTDVDANWILGINTVGNVIAADFEANPGGANQPISGTTTITQNVWHHAAATYNGTSWALYLDGNLEATASPAVAPRSDSTQRVGLGTMITSNGTALGRFQGVIDEARVWDHARTGSEIVASKNESITSGSGLVARWGLNEGSGTIVGDAITSPTAAVGTVVGGPDATWVDGFVPPAPNAAPAAPTLNAPANGATGVGTSPTLSIAVSDPDSDPLTVTFFGRPLASGVFSQIAQNTAVASGATTTTTWSSLGAGQTFEWYATVSDGTAATTGPTWTFSTAPGSDPVFVGAGDIADCARTQDEATAAIVGGVSGTVWTTGDNVYPTGTAANYTNCYEPSWGGAIKARTRPVPGNHDWSTGTPPETLAPYRAYFGASATDANNKDYYSYDIAASNWHVVNLDSECQLVTGGCAAGSPQEVWLAADLAANSSKNVIALWHKPRYSSGITNYQTVQPLWDDLYAAGVDILLVGHDHVYERFVPIKSGATLASQPVADPTYGIHSFTVGTGGAAGQSFGTPLTTSAARAPGSTYGVLKLTLHASTYDWTFLPIAGTTYTDSGTGSVHAAPPAANSAPVAPTLNAPANAATGVGTSPTLSVGVSDPDGDPLTVTFFGRPSASGTFSQIAQNTAVASGATTTTTWSSLGAGQTFEWYATVSDGTLTTTGPTWTFSTAPGSDPVFVGAGDIASCSVTTDTDTGALIQGIQGSIFTTGDNVYPNGTAADFANCYAPTPWGDPSVKSRTRPVPGNHDWGTGATNTLAGYNGYYGANATDADGKSYYSYDIAASNWHVVNLDSECQLVPGGCAAGSAQDLWLEADLAANTSKNVIALWHKPRYSSGATNNQELQPLWDDLYAAGVDILIDGHDHIYERFMPMASGATLASPPVADATYGIRQFTVGTGGEAHHGLATTLATSQARNDTTFGVLKLTLHSTTYDWKFLPIAGSTFTDSGTGTVHAAPPGPNREPTFDQDLGNRADLEGAVISLDASATDLDNDVLTYAASNLPTGLSISSTTGLITGTIANTAAASSPYSVSVTVRDGATVDATDTFTWTVTKPNREPTFDQDLGNRADLEGAVISLDASATDLDNDVLTYAASNLPTGLSISSTTGLITGTIANTAAASSPYSVSVTVRDGATVDATDTFTWTVTKPNVPPAAPTGFGAKVTTTSVVLDWDNNTEPDLAGYFVERSASASGPWTRLNGTILTTSTYVDGTAPLGTIHYQVVARDVPGLESSPAGTQAVRTIAFRSSSSAQNGASTSVVIPTPAGLQSNDILIATVTIRGAPTITPPAGWTVIRTDTNGTALKQATYFHVVTGGESASFSWALSSSFAASAGIVAYSGVDVSASPPRPIDASNGATSATSTSIVAPAVTTTAAGDLLIGAFSAATNATFTPASGMAEKVEVASKSGQSKGSTELADEILGAAGATGTRTAVIDKSAPGIGQLIALRPTGTAPAIDTENPTTPANLVATASSSQVGLTWTASTDNVRVDHYIVRRATVVDGVAGAFSDIASPTSASYTDTAVAASTTYRYVVLAVDPTGNTSSPSDPADATTPAAPPPAGITLRGAAQAANKGAATIVLPRPSGAQSNDVLVASIDVRGAPSITAPSGWTLVSPVTTGTELTKATYWSLVGANPPASYTWSFSVSSAASGVILAYSGVDQAQPVEESASQANASGVAVAAPAVNASAGMMLIGFFGTATNATFTPPTGMTERGDVAASGAVKVASEAADLRLTATGSSDTRTATATRAAVSIGQSVLLRPAP